MPVLNCPDKGAINFINVQGFDNLLFDCTQLDKSKFTCSEFDKGII